MRHDVAARWGLLQTEMFKNQKGTEEKALELHRENSAKAAEYLTGYSIKWAQKIVDEAWKLGDYLWTKYDEKF